MGALPEVFERLPLWMATVFFGALTVWLWLDTMRQIVNWRRSTATLLRYWITRADGQRMFHPVVRFQADDGQTITAISSWGSWRRPWQVGAQLHIRYDRGSPPRVEIACFANTWGLALTTLILALGSAALLLGL
jgi:hypothetical protein